MSNRVYSFDGDLLLKDAGAVTADGGAQVAAAARVLDIGGVSKSRFEAELILNVSARDVGDADETYDILFQLSDSATFSTGNIDFVRIPVAALGRIEVGVSNIKSGTAYRYARLFTDVGGTTPSINYTGYLAVRQ